MPPVRPPLVQRLMRAPYMGGVIRQTHDAWLRHRVLRYWEGRAVNGDRPSRQLNPVQRKVFESLSETGVAVVHFDELISDGDVFKKLNERVGNWAASDRVRRKERIFLEGAYRESKWKEYILMMTSEGGAVFTPGDPLLTIAMRPEISSIVNCYLGLQPRLFHIDAWKTIPVPEPGVMTGSKRWHRDPEDLKLVKIFLYLNDVDEMAGPLHYIRHSCRGMKYGDLWPQKLPYGSVIPPAEIERRIPREDCAILTASAGMMVFADTTGLHMGGRAVGKERLFATWGFSSHGSVWPRYFDLESGGADLPPETQSLLFD